MTDISPWGCIRIRRGLWRGRRRVFRFWGSIFAEEEAEDSAGGAGGRGRGFEFIERNMEEGDGEFEKYKDGIPVVVVDGRAIERYRLKREQSEAAWELL